MSAPFVALVAFDALAFIGFGVLATVGLAGMLPYGRPYPSAAWVLARYAGEFVLAPAVTLIVIASAAAIVFRRGRELTAYTILVLPWLCWPFFFMRALA